MVLDKAAAINAKVKYQWHFGGGEMVFQKIPPQEFRRPARCRRGC